MSTTEYHKNAPLAIAVERSENRKLGPPGAVSATYVSQVTCPGACPWLGSGCYAEHGPISWGRLRLSRTGTSRETIRAEVHALDRLTGKRPLRLHVVGDCRTDRQAEQLSRAASRFPLTWTYTHAWHQIQRQSWGQISVLASCEAPQDISRAWARGYGAVLLVPDLLQQPTSHPMIPCPAQVKAGQTCAGCKLCWRTDKLIGKLVIGFKPHGNRRLAVKRRLIEIQGEKQCNEPQ